MRDQIEAPLNRFITDGADEPYYPLEAEKELAAFHAAVLEMHGPQEAQQSAEDWIHLAEKATANEAHIKWRKISIIAASLLSARLLDRSYADQLRKRLYGAASFELKICRA